MTPEALLILPRLRIQNANAISSPLTWGFPSPSAFTGFVHALHRRVSSEMDIQLEGVGIVCHHFEAQASEPSGKRTKVFHLSRNPVGSDGKTAAIVEEGRIHLDVSLVIGVAGAELYSGRKADELASAIFDVAEGMRLAGGSVVPSTTPRERWHRPSLHLWPGSPEDQHKLSRQLARRLLPGFALVSREALLDKRWQELKAETPSATQLDALLDLSSLNFDPPALPSDPAAGARESGGSPREKTEWSIRKKAGWLVPIPAGYRSLSELYPPGHVKNARDRSTPFCFVEGVFTIGEWLSPHRVLDVRNLLWIHEANLEEGIYRCTTPHFSTLHSTEGL